VCVGVCWCVCVCFLLLLVTSTRYIFFVVRSSKKNKKKTICPHCTLGREPDLREEVHRPRRLVAGHTLHRVERIAQGLGPAREGRCRN
jgi:hypothetical protein